MPTPQMNLIDRLEKDAKGSLTTILILAIIHKHENTWGYQIKQILSEITKIENPINDSTLYTTLRNLENNYKLIKSEFSDRRRTYKLSDSGEVEINNIYSYWTQLILNSIEYFNNAQIPLPKILQEVK